MMQDFFCSFTEFLTLFIMTEIIIFFQQSVLPETLNFIQNSAFTLMIINFMIYYTLKNTLFC